MFKWIKEKLKKNDEEVINEDIKEEIEDLKEDIEIKEEIEEVEVIEGIE